MSSETIDLVLESENPTVLDVKQKISEVKDTKDSVIKLIFSGKVLDDNKDMQFYKIDETQQIICMIRKNTNSNQSNPIPIPEPLPQTQQVPLNINPPNNTPNNTPNLNFGSLPNMANLSGMPNLNAMPSPEEMQSLQGLFQNPQMSQMMGNMMQNPQMREMMLNSTLQRLNIPPDSPMRSFYENALTSFFNNPDQYLSMMAQMPNMQGMQGMNPNAFANMMNGMGPPQPQPHQPPPVQTQPSPPVPTPNDSAEPTNTEQESNVPITTPTPQPSLNTDEIKQKYSEQIEEIKMMGFDDESKIIEAIAQSYGSVSIALNKLLE